MEAVTFANAVDELCVFFEKKEPKHQSIDKWFDRVKAIPTECVQHIVNRIKDDHDTYPKNIVKTFWAQYHDWLELHPEKKAYDRKLACSECESTGLIHVQKKNERGKFVDYTFRCGRCNQSTLRGLPIGRIGALLMNGYVELPKTAEEAIERNLSGLGKMVGKQMPEPFAWESPITS
jgi:hypothetical protein